MKKVFLVKGGGDDIDHNNDDNEKDYQEDEDIDP